MRKISYRLFLYSPGAASATLNNSQDYFLGELYADNIEVNIKLQDVSTISFTMPQIINGQSNPRINEVLDNYVLELWYGKVDGIYSNGDFEKIRFIIYKTPQEFIDDKYIYKYNGFSLESLLEFKNLVSWEGILIKDFYRVISYNNLESPNDKFTEVNQSNIDVLINSATNPKKYIIIQPSTETVSPLDIFIFETRKNIEDDITNRSSLVSYESTSLEPYNDDSFKPGFYYLDLGEDGFVDYIYIAIPDNIKDFNGILTSSKLFSYHFYDNPISKLYAVGINKNTGAIQNNFYLDLVAEEGDGDTSTYEGFTYQSQKEYFKNGLTIKQLMIGEQTPTSNVPTEDGILFSTGFILGDIHIELESQYRSNLEFNNLTRYQAIKQIAETFDSIPVFDTVNNTVSFYPENPEQFSPWLNNGLSLSYGAYLSALQKDIDSSKIITVAKGLGKDNLPITFVTPTGTDYWEDYQHFLDGYFISDTTGFTITYDVTKGLNIVYPSGSISSKWMPAAQAKVLGGWQYTRDYFHNLMLNNTELEPVNTAHEKYINLYSERLEAIRTLIKLQTEVEQREALKFKYFTLKEHYIQENKNNPGVYNEKEVDYTNKYNEVSFLLGNSKRRLKKLENLIFDSKQDGTTKFTHKGKGVTTSGSPVIELIKPNFNLLVGQLVEGDGIPFGAKVLSIENGLKFTIDLNCTATVNINSSVEIIFTEDLPESLAHKFFEVKTFLNKETWFLNNLETETINLNLLESFKREAVIRDSKIDDDFELLISTIKHVDENKLPKVTIQANVADILAAEEAYRDWDKIKVGESINLYLPELDIDQESLVREIAINFEENVLSFVISTVRNYNRAILTSAFKIVRELKNSEVNFNSYIYDVINYTANVAVPQQEEIIENGENTVTTGAEDENEDAPTTDGEGAEAPPVDGNTVDPQTETFEYLATKGVLINNGKVLAFDQYTPQGADPYTVEVELSAENGFEIRKVEGSAENNDLTITKQAYLNSDGEAVIGPVFIAATDSTAVTLNEASGLIRKGVGGGMGENDTQLNANGEYIEYQFNEDGTKVLGVKSVAFTLSYTAVGGATVDLYKDGSLLASFLGDTNGSNSVGSAEAVYNCDTIRLTLGLVGGTGFVNTNSINAITLNKSITLNNFNVTSTGEVYTSKLGIGNFGTTNLNRDSIIIEPSAVGSNYRYIKLMTPVTAITDNRFIRFPNASGTIALTSDLNDTNTYVTSAAFNISTGVLTLTRNDAATVTVDLDGKYAEDNSVVKLTGPQSIAGTKTFTDDISLAKDGTTNVPSHGVIFNYNSTLGGDGSTELNASSLGVLQYGGNSIWHAGNDGVSSGLDADLLDGQQGSYYTNAANLTGTVPAASIPNASATSVGGIKVRISGSTLYITNDGTNP
jgi:hypothetical protein